MRGRKPTPTALKVLRGNPSKRPLNPDEPMPGGLNLECPTELFDPIARLEWDRTVAPLIGIGQVTAADRTLAIAHCELWATWQSQLAEAVKHPHVVAAGKNKYPMPNPARVMANKTLQLLSLVDEKLGFTPTSRTRVKMAAPASRNKQRERYFG